MDKALSEEQLKEILDRSIREVTEKAMGIQLVPGDSRLGNDLCTVYIKFRRGFDSSLSLRADTNMLIRLAQTLLEVEQVAPQDLEDAAKEYFNVLCGHLVAALHKATHIGARFGVPSFHLGAYSPEGCREQFVLRYFSDQHEAAQLVYHVPSPEEEQSVAEDQATQFRQKEGTKIMAKRVMVVDDSRVQEIQIRKMLEGTDYQVVCYCRSGEEALMLYSGTAPDVVTMDIIMPGMDGLETAQAILEDNPEARIVMVSSLAYDDTFEEADTIGAKAFIDKPFDKEKLLAALDKATSGV